MYSLTSRHPGSLLDLEDAAAVGSPIWEEVLTREVDSPRFTWKKEEKGWACRIRGPLQKEALGAFLSALARRQGVVWLSVDSENLRDDEVTDLVRRIARMSELRALYLDGPFTKRGTHAVTTSLTEIDCPLEHLWVHQVHTGLWGVGKAYRESRSRPPSLGALREREERGRRVDRFLKANAATEVALETVWRELLAHPELVGEQFCWKRIEGGGNVSIACQIKGGEFEKPVFEALIPFLFERGASVNLEISSKSCDDQLVECLSRAIRSFTGTLKLALTGSFNDGGVNALTSALLACPGQIEALAAQGAYSWDGAQALTDAAFARIAKRSRILIWLPQENSPAQGQRPVFSSSRK